MVFGAFVALELLLTRFNEADGQPPAGLFL
jgi:hypothetical protein